MFNIYHIPHKNILRMLVFIWQIILSYNIFMPPPFSVGWGVGGGGWGGSHMVSPLSVPSTLSVPSVHNITGFCLIAFEKICVLDSNFIHRYINIKCSLNSI